ncbi:MAG: YifB family Mg chelatase-like AAA ATPase [Candidatus Pacebacteria bacterium]|nr:YifB family Mg chelatase-like AAA ATPase [Candidatus Paceibacterota bacterium]
MLARIFSAALDGINARTIEVEVAALNGLRSFNIVGLADTSVKEAKERVCSAIKCVGLKPPNQETRRVVINLAPADLKKEGGHYDLPIALGYLLSSGQIRFNPARKIILGELALNGDLRPVKGALSFALLAAKNGCELIILPKENAREAGLVHLLAGNDDLRVIGAASLKEAILFLEGKKEIAGEKTPLADLSKEPLTNEVDLSWIKGQEHSKRGIEVAGAGGHNLFLQGPPGTGKTLLARAMVSIMPYLEPEELLELVQIYSAAGILPANQLPTRRPFRAPHHSASEPAIIGGGSPPRPGEITLAHRGVLFLDEFPEFHRNVLESLRQPMEQGEITVQRSKTNLTLPARFMLIGAANPCPCGFRNDPEKQCTCAPGQVAAYQRKLSGPLMDRLDIFCWVSPLKYEHLAGGENQESESRQVRERITRARNIQKKRLHGEGILTNAEMTLPLIKKHCQLDSASQAILKKSVDSGWLSGRGYHRVLKVSRTIADLDERDNIISADINEALSYRQKETVNLP